MIKWSCSIYYLIDLRDPFLLSKILIDVPIATTASCLLVPIIYIVPITDRFIGELLLVEF